MRYKQLDPVERKAHLIIARIIREHIGEIPWRERALKNTLRKLADEHEKLALPEKPINYLEGLSPFPSDLPDPLEPLFISHPPS